MDYPYDDPSMCAECSALIAVDGNNLRCERHRSCWQCNETDVSYRPIRGYRCAKHWASYDRDAAKRAKRERKRGNPIRLILRGIYSTDD